MKLITKILGFVLLATTATELLATKEVQKKVTAREQRLADRKVRIAVPLYQPRRGVVRGQRVVPAGKALRLKTLKAPKTWKRRMSSARGLLTRLQRGDGLSAQARVAFFNRFITLVAERPDVAREYFLLVFDTLQNFVENFLNVAIHDSLEREAFTQAQADAWTTQLNTLIPSMGIVIVPAAALDEDPVAAPAQADEIAQDPAFDHDGGFGELDFGGGFGGDDDVDAPEAGLAVRADDAEHAEDPSMPSPARIELTDQGIKQFPEVAQSYFDTHKASIARALGTVAGVGLSALTIHLVGSAAIITYATGATGALVSAAAGTLIHYGCANGLNTIGFSKEFSDAAATGVASGVSLGLVSTVSSAAAAAESGRVQALAAQKAAEDAAAHYRGLVTVCEAARAEAADNARALGIRAAVCQAELSRLDGMQHVPTYSLLGGVAYVAGSASEAINAAWRTTKAFVASRL